MRIHGIVLAAAVVALMIFYMCFPIMHLILSYSTCFWISKIVCVLATAGAYLACYVTAGAYLACYVTASAYLACFTTIELVSQAILLLSSCLMLYYH
jgi:hypothetical protein